MIDGNDRQDKPNTSQLDALERDDVIDQALATYTAREPRPGLSQRVLSSVAAAADANLGTRVHLWSWKPAFALAAAFALLAVVAIPLWFRSVRPQPAVAHNQEAQNPALHSSPPAQTQHPSPVASSPAHQTFAPRRRVAPAESETFQTEEIASSAPMGRLMIAPFDRKPFLDEPIALKPINIAPIQIRALN
jgi:hypothetical protein